MKQPVNRVTSKAVIKEGRQKTRLAIGSRLPYLEVLSGMPSQQLNKLGNSTNPAKDGGFRSGLAMAIPLLNHETNNLRFNLLEPEPRRLSLLHTRSNFEQDFTANVPTISSLKVKKEELQEASSFELKTPKSLAPAMQLVIQVLAADMRYSFLGTLPRHLQRAVNSSANQPHPDVIKIGKEISHISYQEFKLKYLSTNAQVVQIQKYLDVCPKPQAIAVGELVLDHFESLVTHKFGHRILKPLVGVHVELSNRIANYIALKFEILVTNEFASRIMQNMVETSSAFRLFCLKRFSKNKSLWMYSIAGLFVLTSCMRNSNHHEYSFVTSLLFKNYNSTIECKTMKRVLVSVIESCDIELLDYIYVFLDMDNNLGHYFEDKFMTYILIALMKREYLPAIRLLSRKIEYQFKDLISTTYFKLLANKMISVGTDQVLDAINNSLLKISNEQLVDICDEGQSITNLYYYVFLTISSFRTEIIEGNKRLLDFARSISKNPVMLKVDLRLPNAFSRCLRN